MEPIQFDPSPIEGRQAIVASFDLCGFSEFCNHPDAHQCLHKFLSKLFDEVRAVLMDGLESFLGDQTPEMGRVPSPDFMKFTGDGAILIWFLPSDTARCRTLCTAVVRGLRDLQKHLGKEIPRWAIDWHVRPLPARVKFGIACGLVYGLVPQGLPTLFTEPADYVGYCVNLAVRLQNHCPQVGFIIHEPVLPKLEKLINFVAHGVKGAKDEAVLIFAEDLSLDIPALLSKFQPVGSETDERIRATWPDNPSEEHRAMVQPRLLFVLRGGPWDRVAGFFEEPLPEFRPVTKVKDARGNVSGHQTSVYRLQARSGLLLEYDFLRNEPL